MVPPPPSRRADSTPAARTTTVASDAGRTAAPGPADAPVSTAPSRPPPIPRPRDPQPVEPIFEPRRASLRGERLVAWSALGALVFATFVFVERIGGLQDEVARVTVAPAVVTPKERIERTGGAAPEPVASATPDAETRERGDTVDALPPADGAAAAAAARAATRQQARPMARSIGSVRKPAPGAGQRARRAVTVLPAPVPAPVVASSAVAHAGAAPQTRWERMREEIAACPSGGLFENLICGQRVRMRYCEGWWGRASECPSGRQADYGN
ncbi:hypothetical protein BURK1_02348 [Burkholderiales bacterium]|nr:hypothetical protein BURK1_02348 [Burkholderiales bacterium]